MIKLLSVADIITVTNAVLGFLAILLIFSNQLVLAATFIFLGLLADGFDGIIARRIGNGHMGEYLESIADMVSLSIAPLALFYMTYYDAVVSQLWLRLLLIGVLVFSLVCSLIRLSSFSLLKEKHFFVGLPTSASAIFLVLSSFLKVEMLYILPFVIVLAFAMISPIRFPKPRLKIDLIAAVFIVATIVLDGVYNNIAPILFLVALAGYIIVGPIYLRKKTRDIT